MKKKKYLEIHGKFQTGYGRCPKILYTNISGKMAYAKSSDPDQTAPEGIVWSGSTLFSIPLSILTTWKAKFRPKRYEINFRN